MPEYTDTEAIIRQNLMDAGCKNEFVEQFIALYKKNEKENLCKPLCIHRSSLLHDLHQIQYKIDCLDYLLQHLRRL